MCSFVRNCQTCLKRLPQFAFPLVMNEIPCNSASLPTISIVSAFLFYFSFFNRCALESHCSFHLQFPDDKWLWLSLIHLFSVFLLWWGVYSDLCSFHYWVLVVFNWFIRILCTFLIQALCQIHVLKIFSFWTLVQCLWGCKSVHTVLKAVRRFFKKWKIKILYDPAILLLGIYSKRTKITN